MERNHTIDLIKFFAIFCVVFIHSYSFNATMLQNNYINLLISEFPRFVIPFFFSVSGFLFGIKIVNSQGQSKYFRKYIWILTKQFVTWYILYLIYDCIIRTAIAIHMHLNVFDEVVKVLKYVIYPSFIYYGIGLTSYHLWFLPALIWSVVILYISIRLKKTKFLLIFSLILNLIGLFGQGFSGLFSLGIETRDALFFGLFYTTLGYCFAIKYEWVKQKLQKVKTALLITLIILSSFLQMIEKAMDVKFLGGSNSSFQYYLSTIPLTICIILFFIKKENIGQGLFISKIGGRAISIYVLHMFFINFMFFTLEYLGLSIIRQYTIFHLTFSVIVILASYYLYVLLMIALKKVRGLLNKDNTRNYKEIA
ncbi:MAG: acyltransferase family protein [Heyndrickxia sp.]